MGQSARYGTVTPNDVFSVVTRLGDALLAVPQIRKGSAFQQIQAMKVKAFTDKTPENVFVRTQHLCGLIDQLRKDANLGPVPRVARGQDIAIPAEVYLSAANCLDSVMELIAHEDVDQALGELQQRTEFTGKTPSDVYGLIALAVGRLEAHLGLSSTANSNASPASPTERSEPQSELVSGGTKDEAAPPVSITDVLQQGQDGPKANAGLSLQNPQGVSAPRPRVAPDRRATAVPVAAPKRVPAKRARVAQTSVSRDGASVATALAPKPKLVSKRASAAVAGNSPVALTDTVSPTMINPRPFAASVQNGAPEAGFKRPGYKFLRQNEDWSGLKGASDAQKTDWWDAIKYVPLNEDGDIWASFGGHMRLRLEDWSGFAFGAPAVADDTFLLWRLMLHSDIHFGDNIRVYVEGKSALATDRELPGGRRAALDSDSLALQQAFVDLKIPFGDGSVTIRPGRQMFLFGKQRLVSPLPWANNIRAWDGVSAIANVGGWNVHGFYTQFVPVRKHDFNQADAQTEFFGFYATRKILDDKVGLDAYFLGLDKEDPVTFNGTTGPEERYTIGGRVFGKIADTSFDYDVEGAYQFGEVGAGDISAYMFASEVGYKLADEWGSPRFKIGFDYASGDDTAGGDVETFNQLYPLGHAYFGYMDFVARQNVIDISPGVSLKPMDKMNLVANGHLFWRAEDADALYHAGGGVVRGGALGVEDEIGSEIDLILKYKFNRHLLGLLGYSHFFAGDFLEESGSSDDMDFVYLQLQYTF